MPDHPNRPLHPATPEELHWTLSHALQFEGRRHHRRADEFMADWVASHLAKCLDASGFVVMKKPAGQGPSYSPGLDRRKNP